MTSPSRPAGGTDPFASRVDLGSWARFTPSLADFLEEACRPCSSTAPSPPKAAADPQPGTRAGTEARAEAGTRSGATVLLTAPAPVIGPEDLPRRRGLWPGALGGRRSVQPSPEVPGLVLVGRGDGVEVAVPAQDAQGRALLGAGERETLESLGWRGREALSRVLPDGQSAAEYATRILIEVLRVPHPADLDHLVEVH